MAVVDGTANAQEQIGGEKMKVLKLCELCLTNAFGIHEHLRELDLENISAMEVTPREYDFRFVG